MQCHTLQCMYLMHVGFKGLWMGIYKLFQNVDGLLSVLPITSLESLHQTIWKWRVLPTLRSLRHTPWIPWLCLSFICSSSPSSCAPYMAGCPYSAPCRVSGASRCHLLRWLTYSLQSRETECSFMYI